MQGKTQRALGCYGDGSFKTRGRGGGGVLAKPLLQEFPEAVAGLQRPSPGAP